jgi:hypothetical protein
MKYYSWYRNSSAMSHADVNVGCLMSGVEVNLTGIPVFDSWHYKECFGLRLRRWQWGIRPICYGRFLGLYLGFESGSTIVIGAVSETCISSPHVPFEDNRPPIWHSWHCFRYIYLSISCPRRLFHDIYLNLASRRQRNHLSTLHHEVLRSHDLRHRSIHLCLTHIPTPCGIIQEIRRAPPYPLRAIPRCEREQSYDLSSPRWREYIWHNRLP